ncbi:Clp protease N-terminal domain-containing protein [Nonomuraea rubra]|uniref:ATP-dependent Clp protease ATP-binding subunit ClpA n=1 Tax=Nonomuraea rubra TaxID=46180 RepID=A0A7X0NMF5_9ACTN|nr:Clp protease N-terminal domain-containing protein [Nonomuraea rubra]MBB6546130.1 ATP-dependent Clp protease ATP-binding subunit ClpA [Nonomuraea rubra]
MLKRTIRRQPLERLLTTRAQRALDLAGQEARAQGVDRVTGDHLLAALARLGEGVAVTTLGSLGVDLARTPSPAVHAELGRLTELARQEAAGLGHRYVGTEHLLLGLLHEGGTATLGIGLHQAREQIVKVLHG